MAEIITLITPTGREYRTSDAAEVGQLVGTRGYKIKKQEPAPENKAAKTPANK